MVLAFMPFTIRVTLKPIPPCQRKTRMGNLTCPSMWGKPFLLEHEKGILAWIPNLAHLYIKDYKNTLKV